MLRIRKAKMIHSAEEFIALRDSDNKEEYDRSAFEEAPLAVWRDLIQRYPDYRRWVAHNKTVPVEILAELCNYGPDIRQFVATKRRLSRELFILLSQDPAATVRQSIAANKKTPLDILQSLAKDEDADIADSATRNAGKRA